MHQPIAIVAPVWPCDAALMVEQMLWLAELGFRERYDRRTFVFVYWECEHVAADLIAAAAGLVFSHVVPLCITGPKPLYPFSFNRTFYEAAQWARAHDTSFLWMEPDTVPLTVEFLHRLEAARSLQQPGRILGEVTPRRHVAFPSHTLSVVCVNAVFPPIIHEMLAGARIEGVAFDIQLWREWRAIADHTELIQDVYPSPPFTGEHDLARIRPSTVLYHQCKTGQLIRLLRRRRLGAGKPVKNSLGDNMRVGEIASEFSREVRAWFRQLEE